MKLAIDLTYYRHNVIPPRCRKPRTITENVTVEIEIAEVSSEQAPVAFRYLNFGHLDEYRYYDGQVFEPYRPASRQSESTTPGSALFPARVSYRAPWDAANLQLAVTAAAKEYSRYIIVDGVVWSATGEPRYEVYALGLGHNHSSTGFGVQNWYNGNIPREFYFRADQYAEAKAKAIEVATRRGDTDSLPRIEQTTPIEVLIADAVRCQPQAEAGDGDPFLNALHGITANAASVAEAALATLVHTVHSID